MKALLIAAGIGFLVSAPLIFAPLASAQSLEGITLGDSEARATKAIPDATSLPVNKDPSHRMIYGGDLMAWVCKGKVYAIHHQTDASLTDYLALVKKETATRGEPKVFSSIDDGTRKGESQLVSEWTSENSGLLVALLYDGQKHQVMASLTGNSACK